MTQNEALLSYDRHMQPILGDTFNYGSLVATPLLNTCIGWIATSEGVDAVQVSDGAFHTALEKYPHKSRVALHWHCCDSAALPTAHWHSNGYRIGARPGGHALCVEICTSTSSAAGVAVKGRHHVDCIVGEMAQMG
jgi:hypothetical protein